MEHKITEGEAEIAYRLALTIPEFVDPLPREKFFDRIGQTDALVLVVYIDEVPAGFKIGYRRDEQYYSWLGAVLPKFRKMGLARALAEEMESRARRMGYQTIWMKTRNRFSAMLHFAIGNGFQLIRIIPSEEVEDHRIVLEKKL